MNAISYFSLPENMKKTAGGQNLIILPFLMNLVMTSGPKISWKTLVDLGSGYGSSASIINFTMRFEEIICVDAADPLLAMLNQMKKELFYNTPVTLLRKNLETEQIPVESGKASMVSCYGVACYMQQLDNLFSEAGRMLQQNGIFFLDINSHAGVRQKNISEKGLESYIHSEEYIGHLSAKNGLIVEDYSITIENPEIGPGCIESYLFFRKE